MRSGVLMLLISCVLIGGGIDPRANAEEYPSHVKIAGASLGTEFLGRSLPGDKTSHMTGKYVVVEVGFYPELNGRAINVSSGDFRLRLNGKRDLVAQSPGIVAGALRNPQWQSDRGIAVSTGVGPGVIAVSPTRRQPRFPGDPEVRQPGGTRDQPKIEDANAEQDAGDAAIRRALAEGPFDRPVAGLLYFACDETLRKLKSIELVYDGPAGKAVLPLK